MSPALSVLMASFGASATIGRALASLGRQRLAAGIEVIVVDSSRDGTAGLVARQFPEVRLVRSVERLYAGDARNRAAAIARGRILACVDADCTVEEDWAARVLEAHRAEHAVIGGVVVNGNPESGAGWAYYFAEFHHWLPGRAAGFVDEVPGCSMTVKRAAFDRFGPFLTGQYCSDTHFHWRLAAAGIRPWLDPAIRVAHHNPTGWAGAFRHELRHGFDFARLRGSESLGRGAALARAATAPLLPIVLFARAARSAAWRPELRPHFVRAAPRLLGLLVGWSAGELRGYLAAAARAA